MTEGGNGVATELAQRPERSIAEADELTIEELTAQVDTIKRAIDAVMKEDEHYGVIPGTKKKSLLKPGAEKLCLLFRLGPNYEWDITWSGEHMTTVAKCSLTHTPTGKFVAAGVGMCSSRESKYAYRYAQRVCPECKQPFIFKSKKGAKGYFCWNKPEIDKHGCGANFPPDEPRIVNQEVGKTDNPDLADTYNTVLKMACKRALIAAVLNGTAASDSFTQDIADPETPESVEPIQGVEVPDLEPVGHAGMSEEGADNFGHYVSPENLEARVIPGEDPPVELAESWLNRQRAKYKDEAIVAAAEKVRARVGYGEPFTTIEDVLLAKKADTQYAIEQELKDSGASTPPAAARGVPDEGSGGSTGTPEPSPIDAAARAHEAQQRRDHEPDADSPSLKPFAGCLGQIGFEYDEVCPDCGWHPDAKIKDVEKGQDGAPSPTTEKASAAPSQPTQETLVDTAGGSSKKPQRKTS